MKQILIIILLCQTTLAQELPEELLLALSQQSAPAGPGECIATNHMRITRAFTPFGNTSNNAHYASPAFTPASNDLLVLFVSYTPAYLTPTVTNTGGTQLPWTLASITNYNTLASPANTLACFYTKLTNNLVPFSMRAVLLVSSGTGVNMNCLRISGSTTNQDFGVASMLQVINIASNATANPRVSITPAASGRNAILFAVGDDVNSASDSTAGNWMIEEGETSYTSTACGLTVGWQLYANGYTMVTNVSTSRDWAGIAVEVKAGTSNCTTETFSGNTYYVNTDSTAGGDGTTTNTAGATRAWASLHEALDAMPDPLTTPTRIYTMGSKADTQSTLQTEWDFRTTNGGYIAVIQADTDRHGGIYRTDKYRLEVTNVSAIYNNIPGHVRLDGLQVRLATTTSGATGFNGIRVSTLNVGAGQSSNMCIIANCIVEMEQIAGATETLTGYANSSWADGENAGKLFIYNCLAYRGHNGYSTDGNSNVWTINCTAVSNKYNFIGGKIFQNCLSSMPTTGDGYGFLDSVNYISFNNASDESSAFGLNSRINQSFSFVYVGTNNFLLQSGDTGAKDYGFPDPGYGLFTNDVTGASRTGTWSIGFHEP